MSVSVSRVLVSCALKDIDDVLLKLDVMVIDSFSDTVRE